MKKNILLLSLSLVAISIYAQTQKDIDPITTQAAVTFDEQMKIELLIKESADIKKEDYLTNSANQSGTVTSEEEDEIKFMQNVNRERDINDCITQLEMINGQMQEVTTKLNGVETSQMANEVKKSKRAELQTKKDELLKKKQMLNEKLELLETERKQNNK